MSHLVAFVDESYRKPTYFMGVVIMESSSMGAARRDVRRHARSLGVSFLHFHDLTVAERRTALAQFSLLSVSESLVYRCRVSAGEQTTDTRRRTLVRMVADLQLARVAEVVLDRGLDEFDGLVIRQAREGGPQLDYRHASNRDEPLLALPDGVAFTVGRGGKDDLALLPGWHRATVVDV